MKQHGPEFRLMLSDWEVVVYANKSPRGDDIEHSVYYCAVGKWWPYEQSKLTIERKDKKFNLTDLPVEVRLYVGLNTGNGYLMFFEERNSDYDPVENHGDYVSLTLKMPQTLDINTVRTLDTLRFRMDEVEGIKRVGFDDVEATTKEWQIPVTKHEFVQTDRPDPEVSIERQIATLNKKVSDLTYAAFALGVLALLNIIF